MKSAIFASFLSSALATTIKYDPTYDSASSSLNTVACSDGANGLETRYGWSTFGQVAGFPNIGASSDVAGWNSPACGQCYAVSYGSQTVHILALDHAADGIVMSEAAMNTLTGGNAVQFGTVDATVSQVDGSQCGLGGSGKARRGVEFEA